MSGDRLGGRRGKVLRDGHVAGVIEEIDATYRFTYDTEYVRDASQPPISLTLPKRIAPYVSPVLFPCLVALLAEGALAEIQCQKARLDERDYFGRLLATCSGDVIGSLRIETVDAERAVTDREARRL